jgi:hypothetical protein
MLRSPPWLGLPLWNICVTNDHGYVPLVVSTSRSFPHLRLIAGFVTRLTRWMSLVEQEVPILPEHLSSPPVFSGVRVTRSLVLYVCFVDSCLSFSTFFFWPLCCLFFFDIRIMIAPLVSSNSSCNSNIQCLWKLINWFADGGNIWPIMKTRTHLPF